MVPEPTQVNKEMVKNVRLECFMVLLSVFEIIGDHVVNSMITEKCLLGQ